MTRHMVRDEVARAVDPVLAELRPNGGSSSYDRLSKRLDAQDDRFVTLEEGQAEILDLITRPPVPVKKPAKRAAKKQ